MMYQARLAELECGEGRFRESSVHHKRTSWFDAADFNLLLQTRVVGLQAGNE